MTWLTSDALRAHPEWLVVLLRAGTKKPDGASWQTTRNRTEIREHLATGGGIGLVCGEQSGVAVLDFDDETARAEMYAELGPLVPWVGSPSGGVHVYVRWSPGLPAKLRWRGSVVGEIQRGPGLQQVVIPPSPYPGNEKRGVPPGGRYEWLTDPRSEPPGLPPAWVKHLEASDGVFAPAPASVSGADGSGLERPSFIPAGDARGTENARGAWDGPPPEELQRRALLQPGGRRRSAGVKFQCAGCRDRRGRDRHMDNALVRDSGKFGCSIDPSHTADIARQLGLSSFIPAVEATTLFIPATPEEIEQMRFIPADEVR